MTNFARPRWLYSVGKKDKAREVLAHLHSRTRDLNSPVVNIEIEDIADAIALDGADSEEILSARFVFILTSSHRALVGLQTPLQDLERTIQDISGHHDWRVRTAQRERVDHIFFAGSAQAGRHYRPEQDPDAQLREQRYLLVGPHDFMSFQPS